ncbi:hypothetical protein AKJ56_01800 [candidate division MSBL1 archaeon SCGC-AAA382N08]|uniref:HTH cro/C1-type domain-containing protein n=1 Tax=candidate division MSBL1 archaeon SCGC-AAA382N08 TaxID=1698285 RepID=A0A133VNU6_9EURY|nr:hypothetical protein AKJ56_01800 [candidate division MSBL1 archaeon SCGC-AAA382N08]
MTDLKKFGQKLKKLRIKNDMTLREVSKKADYDSSNWSKIERGLLNPPSDEQTLAKWADVLNLSEEEKRSFIDLAKTVQGEIPEDILKDQEKASLLPAFFRTIRGEKPTREEFEDLKKKLKEEKSNDEQQD